ncbi:MAG: glycoside hydrolase family 78 protein [Acidobacteria bacterium]|nr:glycoside hydrolase family 78 protein [Acidobacteriota bacterium]
MKMPFFRKLLPGGVAVAFLGLCAAAPTPRGLSAGAPRCEYLVNPVGIEAAQPRLSWLPESGERGQKQTAYRILVASNEKTLGAGRGDLWDSGKVSSAETVNIVYAGKPLRSGQRCYWKVRVWDRAGRPSAWSAVVNWSMALLHDEDWKAQWISYKDNSPLHTSRQQLYLPPAHMYRKDVALAKGVRRAVLYASALGIFDAYINGKRVADAMFSPGWSDYRRRAYYRAWDVTALLNRGQNALGAVVADGWYSGYVGFGLLVGYGPNKVGRYFYGKTPAFLAQLEIENTDGSVERVVTDASWKVAAAPNREADILMGETYDARLEQPGWDQPRFNAASWQPAIRAEDNGSTKAIFSDMAGKREVELGFVKPGRMQAYPGVPVRPIQEMHPKRILEPAPGKYVFDFGQNFSGVARLSVKGPAGTTVRIRYGEMTYPDGRLMTENLRRARATDTYILRGDAAGETWTPRFTYHGFQYVELSGYPGKPNLDAVTGIVVHSDTPLDSKFEASDPIVNRLFQNIVWTQVSNFVELPTDCPQRDERLGWNGDAQIYAATAAYNADTAAFYTKWLDDLEESQKENGAFPDYAPYPMQHGGKYAYSAAWMDAGVIVPYAVYKAYGDTRVLERHWGAMTRFMNFRREMSPDYRGSTKANALGDWLAIGSSTPIVYVDVIYQAYSTRLMAEMADVLGKTREAAAYRERYGKIREVFDADYLNPDGSLKVETQSAYVMALAQNLIPETLRQKTADHLAKMIADNGYRMTTGFLGTYPLLPVLSATGHHDLAVRLFQSREFPSWGYEVANGATTIWERWNGYTKEKGFYSPAMNSYSHYSFGAVCEWMFRRLAGIETDGAGFRQITIEPGPPSPGSNPDHKPIDWVNAEYRSVRGNIISKWKQGNGSFDLEVTIPANTSATVKLPARDAAGIRESGNPLAKATGVKLQKMENGRAWLSVESGSYHFTGAI